MVLVPALLAAIAPAQEKFTLSENDEWVQKGKLDPGTPEGRLAEIKRSLANDETNRAVNLIAQWLVLFEGHSLTAEAYLLRGDCYRARRDYYKALFDYEYIARMYPASDIFVKPIALRRSTRNTESPSVFFVTSSSGVVRATKSIRSECSTREIQTFCPFTT